MLELYFDVEISSVIMTSRPWKIDGNIFRPGAVPVLNSNDMASLLTGPLNRDCTVLELHSFIGKKVHSCMVLLDGLEEYDEMCSVKKAHARLPPPPPPPPPPHTHTHTHFIYAVNKKKLYVSMIQVILIYQLSMPIF